MALWSAPAKALNAYIPNSEGNSVSVIDTETNTVTATITVGNIPAGVAVNAQGKTVYITNARDNTVSVINTKTNTVTATIPVGDDPIAVAVAPDSSTAARSLPNARGADSNSTSIDGREKCTSSSIDSASVPSRSSSTW